MSLRRKRQRGLLVISLLILRLINSLRLRLVMQLLRLLLRLLKLLRLHVLHMSYLLLLRCTR